MSCISPIFIFLKLFLEYFLIQSCQFYMICHLFCFSGSPLTLSHCLVSARYFSCIICNTYLVLFSISCHCVLPWAHFHVNEQCCFMAAPVFATISLANCKSHMLSPSKYSFCPCLCLAHTLDIKNMFLHDPISHHLHGNYKHNSNF